MPSKAVEFIALKLNGKGYDIDDFFIDVRAVEIEQFALSKPVWFMRAAPRVFVMFRPLIEDLTVQQTTPFTLYMSNGDRFQAIMNECTVEYQDDAVRIDCLSLTTVGEVQSPIFPPLSGEFRHLELTAQGILDTGLLEDPEEFELDHGEDDEYWASDYPEDDYCEHCGRGE